MTHVHSDSITDCPAGGKKKGLLIAVRDNRVKGFSRLYHAHDDAEDLRHLLMERFGYAEEDIILMMDHKDVRNELWPTKTRIRTQIQLFVKDVSAGDHLFFYYSGHGHQVPCRHHTEPDGLDEEIWTCNGKEIMDNELKEWLVNPLPRGCKLFALWDSCHSHTILDLDHDDCNEPGNERQMGQSRESGSQSALRRVLPKRFWRNGATPIQRSAFTVSPYELRGRPVARVSVPEATLSAGSSPQRCKWTPIFMEKMQRFLSPLSWFPCNGSCSFPTEGDTKRAHVVSLSACKDNESAFDDNDCNETVIKFFIEHMRTKPKSTLRELLLAIRQRVERITTERQALDMKNQVISRRSTFANGRKIRTEWTPKVVRRNTEVNASTLDELFQFTPSSTREEDKNKYSQQPSYSSHYRLNLDELVDI
ncbi:caspase domain-containing protein, partial [Boletus edulis]